MEREATIQDGGNLDNEALLSTDDLIMKIGSLLVENMHKERLLAEVKRRASDAVNKAVSESSQAKVEAEGPTREIEQARGYKQSHDQLAIKHSSLQEAISKVNDDLAKARAEIKEKDKELGRLESERNRLTRELEKAPKPRNLPKNLSKLTKAELIALLEER